MLSVVVFLRQLGQRRTTFFLVALMLSLVVRCCCLFISISLEGVLHKRGDGHRAYAAGDGSDE